MAHTLTALVPVGAVLLILLARRLGHGGPHRRGGARRLPPGFGGPFLPGTPSTTSTPFALVPFDRGGSCTGSPVDGGSSWGGGDGGSAGGC